MASDELSHLELVEVARLIQARRLSAVEVTKAVLERIAEWNPQLKCYSTVTPEIALTEAAQLDFEASRGTFRGKLHGVPIAVKDLISTKNIPTTAGMSIYRDRRPDCDATVIARLREAGAILLGKLQLTEGAFGAHHPTVDPPVNPWSPLHWTGSSSSGSGVATAAGLCYGSLGTDTLGSIRFPSTMNGITGLKPTWGRVSRAGVFALAPSLDHVGPMTRSSADAAAILTAIAGPDPNDPTASQSPVPDYLSSLGEGVRGLRVGIDRKLISLGTDSDAMLVTEHALDVLTRSGAVLCEVNFPSASRIVHDSWALCAVEASVVHEATYPSRADQYGPVLATFLETGGSVGSSEVSTIWLRRITFRGELDILFREIDLLIVPVMDQSILTIAALAATGRTPSVLEARTRFTAPFNMSGYPTLTLPGGMTADGLPIGFQLVGRPMEEALVLRSGYAFQQETDWHTRNPCITQGFQS